MEGKQVDVRTGNRRLLKLAKFLRKLPREKFDYSVLVKQTENGCGTVCCAVGWMPAVDPRNWKWVADGTVPVVRGNGDRTQLEYFSINNTEFSLLFTPWFLFTTPPDAPQRDATPKQVAAHIEKFVKGRQP